MYLEFYSKFSLCTKTDKFVKTYNSKITKYIGINTNWYVYNANKNIYGLRKKKEASLSNGLVVLNALHNSLGYIPTRFSFIFSKFYFRRLKVTHGFVLWRNIKGCKVFFI